MLAAAVFVFQFVPEPYCGIAALLPLLLGLYGLVRGIMFVVYTMFLGGREAKSGSKGSIPPSILEGLSKLAALALVIAQLMKLCVS